MKGCPVKLSDVLETWRLAQRAPSMAKRLRAQQIAVPARAAHTSLEALTEEMRLRCGAQSAGISLFRRADPIESRWIVATGALREYAGSGFPLRHSLCGVAAEFGTIQLFRTPQRYFKWIAHAGLYISEALVLPLADASGRFYGTVWVMSHRGTRPRFDSDDARMLESMAALIKQQLTQRAPPPDAPNATIVDYRVRARLEAP